MRKNLIIRQQLCIKFATHDGKLNRERFIDILKSFGQLLTDNVTGMAVYYINRLNLLLHKHIRMSVQHNILAMRCFVQDS